MKKKQSGVLTLFLALFLNRIALGAPCPVETEMYGGVILDGSADEDEIYLIVDDDDMSRMTSMRYCKSNSNFHFLSFEATFYSPSAGFQSHEYGVLNDQEDDCYSQDFGTEELMFLLIYFDSNDVEGMNWTGNGGTEWKSKADGTSAAPLLRMKGRPIGFRVTMGNGGSSDNVSPLVMSVVYNACNCPASTYTG